MIAVLATTHAIGTRADEDDSSPLTGGAPASGPPAPAVPGIAATPEPAAHPAVPGAPAEPGVAAREEPAPTPAPGPRRSVKIWPLFEYESDPATATKHVSIFGPLLEYRADAERQNFAFLPFISISQSRVGHDDDVHILYRLLHSHWGQTEQVTTGLGGLFTYRTRTSEDGRTLESQSARLLPVYFYDWKPTERFGTYSIAPLYTDIENAFGYDRVQMLAFPAYVRLQKPPLDRRYYLFPLVSAEGTPGNGYRLWPFPIRDRQGRRVEQTPNPPPDPDTFFPDYREDLDARDQF